MSDLIFGAILMAVIVLLFIGSILILYKHYKVLEMIEGRIEENK